MTKWLNNSGQEEDIVISSRIRLARNLADYKFPSHMSVEEAQALTDQVLVSLKGEVLDSYDFVKLEDLSTREELLYVEEHLISPSLLQDKEKSSFLLSKDERATIMINEEDHLRIQTLSPGLNLVKSWQDISVLDDLLESRLDYAYDEKLGYLTACPTNVGTGLRASVMLHLPCLSMTGNIKTTIEGLRKLGLTARGIYGEGSQALGSLYQISNQTTLGESEEEIIDRLNKLILQIISRERASRSFLGEQKKLELEDKIFRSLGILSYSRMLSSREAMEHLSNLRMGWRMGILKNRNFKDLIKLMIEIQPAKIQASQGKDMSSKERDSIRSQIVREFILDLEG